MKASLAKVTEVNGELATSTPEYSLGLDNIGGFLANVNEYLWYIVGFVALALLLWAGILLIKSEGDESALKKANYILFFLVTGLIAIFFSATLIKIVVNLNF